MRQVNREESIREFYHIKFSPDVAHMLLSITRELRQGALRSSNENKDIILTYRDGSKIVCNGRLKTKDGWMPGIELIPITAMASIAHTLTKPISVNVSYRQVSQSENLLSLQGALSFRGIFFYVDTVQ